MKPDLNQRHRQPVAPTAMGRSARLARQAGILAVELGLVMTIFITLLFMVLELSRALYIWNTLQEVTRRAARAASVTDFSNAGAMTTLRQIAIFRDNAGSLAFGDPITDQHIRIDYLSLQTQANGAMSWTPIPTGALPACPMRNRIVCTADSSDPSCIRLVRVRICTPGAGATCMPVRYESMLPLVKLPMNLPLSTSIVRAESLGYTPGAPTCN